MRYFKVYYIIKEFCVKIKKIVGFNVVIYNVIVKIFWWFEFFCKRDWVYEINYINCKSFIWD